MYYNSLASRLVWNGSAQPSRRLISKLIKIIESTFYYNIDSFFIKKTALPKQLTESDKFIPIKSENNIFQTSKTSILSRFNISFSYLTLTDRHWSKTEVGISVGFDKEI